MTLTRGQGHTSLTSTLLFSQPSLGSADTSLDSVASNANRVDHHLKTSIISGFIIHPYTSALLLSVFVTRCREAERRGDAARNAFFCSSHPSGAAGRKRLTEVETSAWRRVPAPLPVPVLSQSQSCGQHHHRPTLCCFPYLSGGGGEAIFSSAVGQREHKSQQQHSRRVISFHHMSVSSSHK